MVLVCCHPMGGFYSDTFEVLALTGGKDADLVLTDANAGTGTIPDKAVHGGAEYDFETFICRVVVNGTTYVGKTRAGYAGCLYFDGLAEKPAAIYSVLVLR